MMTYTEETAAIWTKAKAEGQCPVCAIGLTHTASRCTND